MRSENDVQCKPFKNHHTEQLKLVTSFDRIDFNALSGISEYITELLSCEGAVDYIDESRIRAIAAGVERRINNLNQFAVAHTAECKDSTDDDVEEDIAEDYTPKMNM